MKAFTAQLATLVINCIFKKERKANLPELVLRCIKSSDAEQRRIFHRMVHATTKNKEKTRNRREKHCLGKPKTGAPRHRRYNLLPKLPLYTLYIREEERKQTFSPFPIPCANRGQSHQQKLFLHHLIVLLPGKIEHLVTSIPL